jgi:hypothetical protein
MRFENCRCGFSGWVDYYNAYKTKRKWEVVKIGAEYDTLKCPKCQKETVIKAK